VRSGSDVAKALALGATAVGIGRTYLYALVSVELTVWCPNCVQYSQNWTCSWPSTASPALPTSEQPAHNGFDRARAAPDARRRQVASRAELLRRATLRHREMGHDHPGSGSLSIAHALVDGDGH
jgi:hypothetical protein